jgi:hypothetical protein
VGRILAIDPGKHAGWAYFDDDWSLKWCGVNDVPSCSPTDLVIEIPQVYPHRAQKGDPNDLITVAFGAGLIAGRFPKARLRLVKPHQWKGTVPKEIHNRRVLAALTEGERVVAESAKVQASVRHNMIDAIGLGLWHLGRVV